MAINERLIHTAAAAAGGGTGNQEEGLILHLDANDVDSYDGDGSIWYDITNHEYTPAVNPAEHFNTVTYTGTGASNAITGVGFQPDLIWIKDRNQVENHYLIDSVRGKNGSTVFENLYSNLTNAQANDNAVTSLDTDGFTLQASGNGNVNAESNVAWCFKAGGAAVSNTDGTVTSQVSVNNDLGFSIVSFTTSGGSGTVGHGLDVPPEVVLMKRTSTTSDWYWFYNSGDNLLRLNTSASASSDSTQEITSTTFKDWASSGDFIAYCFASKRGVSKVGSYTGTGTSGNKVYTGFQPAWVMIKNTSGTGNWMIYDIKRDTDGTINNFLEPNTSDAEASASTATVTPSADGFTLGNSNSVHLNKNGNNFIYLAFAAEKPSSLTPDKDSFTEGTVTTGADLELKANDYSGSGNWLDSTSNNNDATITGATFVNDGESDYFEFDGTNDYMTISNDTSFSSATNFSVEMWVNLVSIASDEMLATLYGSSTDQKFDLRISNTSGNIRWIVGTSSGTYDSAQNMTSTGALSTNEWSHLVAVYDDTNNKMYIYIDGELDSTKTNASNGTYTSITDPILIGKRTDGYHSNIKLGAFRFYSKTLSAAEVKDNFDAGKGLYTYPDLELHLDPASYSGSGTTWTADTGNNGTLVGNASYDKELGDFFDLDGSGDYISLSTSGYLDGDFTVEMWWNFDGISSSSGYKMLWGGQGYGGSGSGLGHYIQNNTIRTWTYVSGTYGDPVTSAAVLESGKWHHIVLTRSGSTFTQYLDGNQVGTGTGSSASLNSANTTIGKHYNSTANDVNGRVGQVRVYDNAFTADQVMQNYRFTKNDYPNGYNGTLSGGLSSSDWNSSGHFDFDGSNDYVKILGTNDSPVDFSKKSYTISAWINPDVVNVNQPIVSKYGTSDSLRSINFSVDSDGTLRLYERATGTFNLENSSSTISASTWTHVALVRDSSTVKFYINGALDVSRSATFTPNAGGAQAVNIGSQANGNYNFFNGKISDVKLFDRPLTSNEISAQEAIGYNGIG